MTQNWENFRRKVLFLIPYVWQDGALSVLSSHTWLHLDQRGRNKTSNQIGISLKIFLWNFFAFFEMKNFGFHRTLIYGTWILERSLYLIKFIFFVFLVIKKTKFLKIKKNREMIIFSIFTFVIIPDVPWRKNFFAFRAFVRSFPLETKLVLTRVES